MTYVLGTSSGPRCLEGCGKRITHYDRREPENWKEDSNGNHYTAGNDGVDHDDRVAEEENRTHKGTAAASLNIGPAPTHLPRGRIVPSAAGTRRNLP
jgi:hypothetical protein